MWESCVWETFDEVAGFQSIRAAPVGRQRKGSQIVHVADHERVIVGLSDFVAETGRPRKLARTNPG